MHTEYSSREKRKSVGPESGERYTKQKNSARENAVGWDEVGFENR